MPSLKEINKKITSLKNTRKITRAMKMIAAVKLRKAQAALNRSEPYAQHLNGIITKTAGPQGIQHPLFKPHDSINNIHVVAISSDRGLCGGFNNNVIKKTLSFFKECRKSEANITMRVLGKRCYEFFRKRDCRITEYHEGIINNPTFASTAPISETLINDFLSGKVDEVYILFNELRSAISQVPVCQRLLPVPEFSVHESPDIQYLNEPSQPDIINDLVIRSVKLALFRSLLTSVTAEHAARMTAMDSATTNCEDLVDKKTLERNKARQAAITKELVEIVSGAESL